MGSVADIRSSGSDIPYPICVREGDIIKRVVFNEDVPHLFKPGGFVYVRVNYGNCPGLFVIETPEGPTLVRLAFSPNGSRVSVESLHESYPSYHCKKSELDIIGKVVEIFPTGQPRARWICYEEGLEFHPSYSQASTASQSSR